MAMEGEAVVALVVVEVKKTSLGIFWVSLLNELCHCDPLLTVRCKDLDASAIIQEGGRRTRHATYDDDPDQKPKRKRPRRLSPPPPPEEEVSESDDENGKADQMDDENSQAVQMDRHQPDTQETAVDRPQQQSNLQETTVPASSASLAGSAQDSILTLPPHHHNPARDR